MSWTAAWNNRKYRALLLYTFACALLFVVLLPTFFQYIQNKPGTVVNDPLLAILPSHDLSVPIFLLIYGAIIVTVIVHFFHAEVVILSLATYCTVSLFRVVTIYVFTLEPPIGLVTLHDPFVSLIAYDTSLFAKDLFFSGHISTLLSIVFTESWKTFRMTKIIITITVAILLLFQHIHYSIDILAAPVFTYAAYVLVKRVAMK